MAEGGPLSYETQRDRVKEFIGDRMETNDKWYVIDARWFKQWKKYVGFDKFDDRLAGDESANPGPIDNTPILKENDRKNLKEQLIEDLQYILVSERLWKLFSSWYSLLDGQDPIARSVISHGQHVKTNNVEVYLLELKLCENSRLSDTKIGYFSRADTIENLIKDMRQRFNISSEKEVRLWSRDTMNHYEQLSKMDETLSDASLYQCQVIVIEQKNDDGTWERDRFTNRAAHGSAPPTTDATVYTSTRSYGSYSHYNSDKGRMLNSIYNYESGGNLGVHTPGICGLTNLGNTCFMNSALQCLSNVPMLTEYMLGKKWEDELNEDNPLGMHGEIARSYANLLVNMWSGKLGFTVPKQFKIAVGRFAPQFSGYQQQDSQELMAFLLDGLHEDLNRIKKKPYVEQKEDENKKDEELATEAWENYKKRNDSIIVDIFHGLLKSTLVCPECDKISVTFDPFCYLSLPLPFKRERKIEVFFVPIDAKKKITQYKVTVPKYTSIRGLCESLSKMCGTSANLMVVTDVFSHKFHKVFVMDEPVSGILERDDIFVYEIPEICDNKQLLVAIYMREKKMRSPNEYLGTSQLFGQPFLVAVPRQSCSYAVLYDCILHNMQRYVTIPDKSEKWWITEENDNNKNNDNDEDVVNGDVDIRSEGSTQEADDSDDAPDNTDMEVTRSSSEMKEPLKDRDDETKRLFAISLVNNFGSTELQKIQDDGQSIKLPTRSYIAIDWDPDAKKKFYNEKSAEEFTVNSSMNDHNRERPQVIQLNDCLSLFTTTEKLGHHDLWYCPRCKKHQQATKKFDIWDLPDVLVIHLKRFQYERNINWRDKIDALVEFPTRGLTLKDYVINPQHTPNVYDLVAVSNHYGGLGGGHYTAYAKNAEENEWYYFDDASVSKSREEAVVTKASYVVIYQKRNSSNAQNSSSAAETCVENGVGKREGVENMDTSGTY